MDHATQRLETGYEPIHVDVWRTNLQLSDGAVYTKKFTDPFHKNGNFHTPSGIFAGGGATFGGNITVSWGGRTAIFHENGDVAGPIWGGALSNYLRNTFVTNMRLTGIAWTGSIGNAEHLWNNGGVIVGIQSIASYATNIRVAVRYLQKWVNGSWVGIVSD